jgi:Xaa-Pro aminopeptidase
MSFTIEPGLYIPADDESAPKEFRGIGVRIEDNVVVTANGCENLTASCPKEVADLEAIIGKGYSV